ncbi:MAG: hypothetical protein DWI48_02420 [Chloroflexi bacterium]|nr:MAG: hypothetical protein DWI48_02420 [Chloroflexota bacterium]
MTNDEDNDWRYSSEGDLDPDLTEEAGYSGWDPPRRRGGSLMFRIVVAITLACIVGGALSVLMR